MVREEAGICYRALQPDWGVTCGPRPTAQTAGPCRFASCRFACGVGGGSSKATRPHRTPEDPPPLQQRFSMRSVARNAAHAARACPASPAHTADATTTLHREAALRDARGAGSGREQRRARLQAARAVVVDVMARTMLVIAAAMAHSSRGCGVNDTAAAAAHYRASARAAATMTAKARRAMNMLDNRRC